MNRVTAKIWDSTHKKLMEAAEKSGLTYSEIIDKALTRYLGHLSDKTEIQQLKVEIERLKSQSPQRTAEGGLTALESGSSSLESRSARQEQHPSPSTIPEPPLPFGASPISPLALTDTSTNTTNGNDVTIQLSLRQRQALLFHGQLLMLKVAATEKMEQEKRETARQIHFRKPRMQPVQDDICDFFIKPCPLNYNRNHCSTAPCDRRRQCRDEGIIKDNLFTFNKDNGGLIDAYIPYMR